MQQSISHSLPCYTVGVSCPCRCPCCPAGACRPGGALPHTDGALAGPRAAGALVPRRNRQGRKGGSAAAAISLIPIRPVTAAWHSNFSAVSRLACAPCVCCCRRSVSLLQGPPAAGRPRPPPSGGSSARRGGRVGAGPAQERARLLPRGQRQRLCPAQAVPHRGRSATNGLGRGRVSFTAWPGHALCRA